MTIEERAMQRYELHNWMSKATRDAVKYARKIFVKIATEQREIDIQRAVELYKQDLEEIVAVINRFSKDNVGEVISIEGSVMDFENKLKGEEK